MLNVNSEAWGTISDWTKASGTTGDYFTYPWNRKDWSGLYSNGYQTIDEDIDLSIAPWRINKKSALLDLNGPYYYNNWKEEGSETIVSPTDRYQARLNMWDPIVHRNVPFILSYWSQTGTTENPYWTKYWAYKVFNETKGNNITGNRYPVANFRYDKIRICPVIWLIDTDPDNMTVNMPTRSQWGGFPTLEDIAAKPYCVGVGFEIFIDKNGTWTESQLTVDIDTEFNGCNDEELAATWFAGYYGYKQMRMPYRYNPAGTHYNNLIFGYAASNAPDSGLWCHGSSKAFANAFSRGNSSQTSLPSYFPINGLFGDVSFNEKTTTTSTGTFTSVAYIELTEDIYEDFKKAVMKELAYIGLPFTTSRSAIATASAENNNLYYPVFDSQRCTTGEYKTGSEATTLPNYQWKWIYELPELPDDIEPHEEEEDFGFLHNEGKRRFIQNGLEIHCMPYSNFHQFIYALNNLNMTDPDNTQWQLDFKGSNPADYIVSAFYSFVIPPVTTATQIKLGPVDVGGSEYNYDFNSNYAGYITFGSKDIDPFYNDFRDYAPYTQIELYLPLCGTIDIDPAYFIGHSMQIDYYYDIYTMACTANIYRDNITLYKVVNGTIGAQIPMLSTNMGNYQNQIKSLQNAQTRNMFQLGSSALSLSAAIGGVIAAPATGGTSLIAAGAGLLSGASGLAKGIESRSELDYQIDHTAPSVSITGSADPQVNFCEGQLMPKIIIKRAKMITTYDDEMYAKTIGFACNINDTLGYVSGDTNNPRSGLAVCSSIDTSGISQTIDNTTIAPTAEEINMIKQAASSGIIL